MDLEKLVGKGKLKSHMREAFLAGGRYYLKTFGRGDIAKKDLGDIDNFGDWYKKQKF